MQALPLRECVHPGQNYQSGGLAKCPISYSAPELLRTPRLTLTRIITAWKEMAGRDWSLAGTNHAAGSRR